MLPLSDLQTIVNVFAPLFKVFFPVPVIVEVLLTAVAEMVTLVTSESTLNVYEVVSLTENAGDRVFLPTVSVFR